MVARWTFYQKFVFTVIFNEAPTFSTLRNSFRVSADKKIVTERLIRVILINHDENFYRNA